MKIYILLYKNETIMSSETFLIFDLDGTLLDSALDISNSLIHSFERFGLEAPSKKEVYDHVGSGVTPIIKRVKDPATQKQLAEYFFEHYENNCHTHTAFFEGMEATLRQLHDYKKVILTNKISRFTKKIYQHFQLDQYFLDYYCSDSFAEKKPSGLPIQKISEIHDTNISNIMMIGDTMTDINAAKAAKTKSIYVTYGYGQEGDEKNADHYIQHANELKEAIS